MSVLANLKARFNQFAERIVLSEPPWQRSPRRPFGELVRKLEDGIRYPAERLLGWSDPLTPPLHLRCGVGAYPDPRVYRTVGDQMSQHFIDNMGLRANDDVLDMGCGCGHMAVPLCRFLSARGSYSGFDVDPILIDWCRTHISSARSNFHFWTANVFNASFNPQGTISPAEYRFPYQDASFDFIIAKSLFTHLPAAEAENYFNEAARVLRPGGRFYISVFLLNDESRGLIAAGKSTLDLRHAHGPCLVVDPLRPEVAVAIPETMVQSWITRQGLRPLQTVTGNWCGRTSSAYQDEYLLIKE